MDIAKAITFITEDPRWKEKMGMGLVVVVASAILSIVLVGILGFAIVTGYSIRLLQNVRDGQPHRPAHDSPAPLVRVQTVTDLGFGAVATDVDPAREETVDIYHPAHRGAAVPFGRDMLQHELFGISTLIRNGNRGPPGHLGIGGLPVDAVDVVGAVCAQGHHTVRQDWDAVGKPARAVAHLPSVRTYACGDH